MLDKGKIIPVNIEEEMKKSYIDYAMSVIVSRALPDVRDGLKPVHRRILYVMSELALWPEKAYRKCAGIVGDVLGNYHPHGDASVYDALVRLAQDFSMRYPLVNGHGNFGSVDNDPPAAMRYTEAKLYKMSVELLTDIDKDTVDYKPNYDERLLEPSVLPAKYPNLLVNGSYGIAVGMACNIPPHNLTEVINGTCAMIDNPDISTDELLTHIKGPDFPTAGIVVGKSGIKQAYETGRGKICLRGKAEIEEDHRGRYKIIISEIPYQVNKAAMVENIARLVQEKTIVGISDLRDESDRTGLRVVVELKRDANPNVVLNLLYKHTQLQGTFGILLLALVNNQPKVLSLKEILFHYIEHRKEIVTRRTKYELTKAEARLHILEGLRIALDHIDAIIKIIRASKDDNIARSSLMESFNLSEIQANAILEMKLRTLTGLQRSKIEDEYDSLVALIKHLRSILENEQLVLNIIKEELNEVKKSFGDERRTAIIHGESDIEIESLIKEESNVVTITHFGYIKRIATDAYKSQKRGGKGVTAMNTRENDFIEHLFETSTHDYIMFFTNTGKVYRLKAYELPESSRQAKGTAIVNLLQLAPNEKIAAVIPVSNFEAECYILMATKNGLVKKTSLSQYSNIRKTGIQGITLKDEDELIDVRITSGDYNIALVTRSGLSIRFKESDVRAVGRTSMGVKGITLGKDDYVVGMEPIKDENGCILAITENGFGKRTAVDEYRAQTRAGKGILTYKTTEKTGHIIGVKIVDDDDDIMIITDTGIVIRIKARDISILGRNTQGVTLMRTSDGGKVVNIAKIAPDEDEILEENDQQEIN
ncbi:MAG: DNA gyrase subunit A [Clostridia bacterium]|nr:DNA gyrase subunit A [Clostridia bacterium]MDD4375245.1 DNA gyrase subunit A [Clostridia bacterium]